MPSRYYKNILPVLVLVLAGSVAAFAGYRSLHTSTPAAPIPIAATSTAAAETQTANTSVPHAVSVTKVATKVATIPSKPIATSSPVANAISATLTVGTLHYALSVPANTTVETALLQLAATNPSFAFTQTQYPGLGEFVESINGKAATDNYNWMLYVNGAQAQIGISNLIVHAGDTLDWKYEQ